MYFNNISCSEHDVFKILTSKENQTRLGNDQDPHILTTLFT